MEKRFWLFVFFLFLVTPHFGTVRKKDDPILRTQTDPIAYKDKMEEIKDGEKEAPSPSFRYYPKSRFLAEPPVEGRDGDKQETQEVPEAEEVGEEEEDPELELEDWWLEEDVEDREEDSDIMDAWDDFSEAESDQNSFKDLDEIDESGEAAPQNTNPKGAKG